MSTATMPQEEISSFTIRQEVQIAAPVEVAYQAMLDELGPDGVGPNGANMSMKLEAWPGGRWYRDLGNNMGHLWGHVQVIKAPTLLEITGPLPMSYPVANHIQYRFKEHAGGTLMTFVHRSMGLITPEHRDGMQEGWQSWLDHIRANAEGRHQAR